MSFKEIKINHIVKIALLASVIYVLVVHSNFWHMIKVAIMPLLYAFAIAYILDYAVKGFENRLKLRRSLSILLTFILFVLTITVVISYILPKIIEGISSLVFAMRRINIDFIYIGNLEFDNPYFNQVYDNVIGSLIPILEKVTNATGFAIMLFLNEIQRFTASVISLSVSIIIAIYMLIEKKDLMARIKRTLRAYLSEIQTERVLYITHLADKIFRDFFVGKLLDSMIIGFLAFLAFSFFGFPYALIMAVIIGITNMIPYFGPFIGAVPSAIITFIATPTEPLNVFWVLLIILILQQLDGWIIGPLILGDSIGVSAFWIVIAVTIGGATFGLWGMFLGVPVCVLIKTLIEEDVEKRLKTKGVEDFMAKDIRHARTSRHRK